MKKFLKSKLAIVLMMPAIVSVSSLTYGQDNLQLEEIIVIATKRAQSTQDIPLSLQTVSGDTMDKMMITDFSELQSTIPSLRVGYGITTETVVIRGLGSGAERSFEQSVGMFIDGFYMPRSRQYQSPFFDVSQVEVARGPQSVVHGLNSTAGAISVVSNRSMPGDPFSADIMLDTELEHGGESTSIVLGGGISDNFGLRVAGKFSDRDGYYKNTFTGEDEGDTEDSLIRVTAVWQVTDSTSLTLKHESAERESFGDQGEIFSFAAGDVLEPNDNKLNWQRSTNGCLPDRSGFSSTMDVTGFYELPCSGQKTDLQTTVANLEINLKNHVVAIMAGRSEFEYDVLVDLDTTADSFVDASIDENFEQDAVEIRLTSNKGETFDYMVGAYYHNWELYNQQPGVYGPALYGGLLAGVGPYFPVDVAIFTDSQFEQTSKVTSLFAQGTWQASDDVRITGGLRWINEEKSSTYNSLCDLALIPSDSILPQALPGPLNLCSTNPASLGLSVERSSDNVLPEIAFQWDANDNAMIYGKYGESVKGGGFTSSQRNPASDWSPADQEYQDENATGIELGIKSRWMDDRLEVNAAIFDTEFEDLQVNTFTPVGGVIVQNVTNAAKASSSGLEVDFRYAANEWLQLGGAWSLQNVEYGYFANGTCSVESGLASPCDLSGRPLPNAPDWAGVIYADITSAISDNINFVANLSVSLSDEHYTDGSLEPAGLQDSWTKIDARIGVESSDGKWSLALIGRNLGDETVLSQSQSFFDNFLRPTYFGYLEPPRRIYLQARYRFGG